jgi:hypothetical protein
MTTPSRIHWYDRSTFGDQPPVWAVRNEPCTALPEIDTLPAAT